MATQEIDKKTLRTLRFARTVMFAFLIIGICAAISGNPTGGILFGVIAIGCYYVGFHVAKADASQHDNS